MSKNAFGRRNSGRATGFGLRGKKDADEVLDLEVKDTSLGGSPTKQAESDKKSKVATDETTTKTPTAESLKLADASSKGAVIGETDKFEIADHKDVEEISKRARKGLKVALTANEARMYTEDELRARLNGYVLSVATSMGKNLYEADTYSVSAYLLNELDEMVGGFDNEVKSDEKSLKKNSIDEAKDRLRGMLMDHIDPSAAAELSRVDLAEQVGEVVGELLVQERLNLNLKEQRELVALLLDDMLGLGPLEPLLADGAITDIMVNGPNQVYVERNGKLTLSDVKFRDGQHLMNIAQRIVTAVGRRVDESSPICDARLLDGSRVNVIAPPLAIDGASISIRKFAEDKITLDRMLDFKSISANLAKLLKIAGACRLNILISGGTGSGKTTMLNALSRMVDKGERVVTIEDAAELQLQQPHVVRLETRPPNLEGTGEVTMRDLVKNALRMRPDRIILGEIRGGEAIDMLQAMNTGHDGSMGTVHANNPREALTRMENMVNMAGMNLPAKAIREQVSASVDLIVQVQRMRDGGRRTTHVTEVVGMEGDVITTQDLFKYEFTGEDADGKLIGEFKSSGVRPHFLPRAAYFGLERALLEVMNA